MLEEVSGYSQKNKKKGGRPPFDPVLMLKVLILQKYYGLSDEKTEFEINDRLSFLSFIGLELGDDVPDARTIWDFKERIDKDKRNGSARLFEAFGEVLSSQGLVAKEESIVDASFVDAPRQRNVSVAKLSPKQRGCFEVLGWEGAYQGVSVAKLSPKQRGCFEVLGWEGAYQG